jgi:hypothetical protein
MVGSEFKDISIKTLKTASIALRRISLIYVAGVSIKCPGLNSSNVGSSKFSLGFNFFLYP